MSAYDPKSLRTAPLATPTDLKSNAITDISGALNILLADMFALYIKTKNFHWHVSGQHFRDYHLMLDEQGEQIFATTDDIAERVRKIGRTTIRSCGSPSAWRLAPRPTWFRRWRVPSRSCGSRSSGAVSARPSCLTAPSRC